MPYRLAITIAGAVSLGSFEAGVLYEVVDALGQHNQTAPPDERVYIDVLTGASAGGVTAAVTAQSLLYTAGQLADPYNNPFYNSWVVSLDINGLLPLGRSESADQSIFSSDYVNSLARQFLLARYAQSPPPPVSHPALTPSGSVRLGLTLSNLNGVDFARPLLSGGTFNYTQFQDQIEFSLDAKTDQSVTWTRIAYAAVACGAFPFAFRPGKLTRDIKDYTSQFVAPWPAPNRDFTYSDGGIFQNQPLGLAKKFVDSLDKHLNSDSRSYLFVSPRPVNPTLSTISADKAVFKLMLGALVNAIYNQAGFQDWIEAETINDSLSLLNRRATELKRLFENDILKASDVQGLAGQLLDQFQLTKAELDGARTQLRAQFSPEYTQLSATKGVPAADVWIDSVLILELAADLHEKDEMYIYQIASDPKDLAGAGFFAFLGFLYRGFRDHDYDLGRQKAQSFLNLIDQISKGKLPKLRFTPKPIHPVQPTPPGGFTPAMIPKPNRKKLYEALSQAVDNALIQEGLTGLKSIVRKSIETFYTDGKIKQMLDL